MLADYLALAGAVAVVAAVWLAYWLRTGLWRRPPAASPSARAFDHGACGPTAARVPVIPGEHLGHTEVVAWLCGTCGELRDPLPVPPKGRGGGSPLVAHGGWVAPTVTVTPRPCPPGECEAIVVRTFAGDTVTCHCERCGSSLVDVNGAPDPDGLPAAHHPWGRTILTGAGTARDPYVIQGDTDAH